MIITDKYKLTLSNVGDTIALSVAELSGEFWSDVVNVPLHWDTHAKQFFIELDENIWDCWQRARNIEDAKDSDFWRGS